MQPFIRLYVISLALLLGACGCLSLSLTRPVKRGVLATGTLLAPQRRSRFQLSFQSSHIGEFFSHIVENPVLPSASQDLSFLHHIEGLAANGLSFGLASMGLLFLTSITEIQLASLLTEKTQEVETEEVAAFENAVQASVITGEHTSNPPNSVPVEPEVPVVTLGSPYEGGFQTYNPQAAEKYYGSRMSFVYQRLAKLASMTATFNINLLRDYLTKRMKENQAERAKEALALVSQLGPTFIKLGQALSIRTDLIPEAYALELRKLQDAVPPFSSDVAREIIKRELKVNDLSEVFSTLSEKPIASASIGQVYRGKLLNGKEVAVKVQRPHILDEIALDLFIMRLITPLQAKIVNLVRGKKPPLQADIDVSLALVDEWGRGFVAEVDYQLEADNQVQFVEAMQKRGLNAVTAPEIVRDFSTKKVITTGWVDGTRLDKDASPDVPRLCNVAVNAYLTMLLDTGVLHCDPHPGNLLRTKDGKLCVLDWGMTLTVPRDLQYSLLEFIAHVNTENYDAVPDDFVNMGFTPPGKADDLRRTGVTEGLALTFRQLSKGGGPKKIAENFKEELKLRYGTGLSDDEIRKAVREEMVEKMQQVMVDDGVDVSSVTGVMEEVSRRNRELFTLPPYILYVTRAFSVLEGIGLSIDPDYSILQECYPYLAHRLFTDDSPRAKAALRTMLLGTANSTSLFSPDKLMEMSSGFTSFTAATTNTDRDGRGTALAQEALFNVVLSEESNAVQEVLVEGAARIVDAVVREGIDRTVRSAPLKAARNFLKLRHDVTEALLPGALKPLAWPLTAPYKLTEEMLRYSAKNEEDAASLRTAKMVVSLAQSQILKTNSPATTAGAGSAAPLPSSPQRPNLSLRDPASVSMAALNTAENIRDALRDPKVRSKIPAMVNLSRKFGGALIERAADRFDAASDSSKFPAGAVVTDIMKTVAQVVAGGGSTGNNEKDKQ